MTKSKIVFFIVTLVLAAAAGFGVAEYGTATPGPEAWTAGLAAAGLVLCVVALFAAARPGSLRITNKPSRPFGVTAKPSGKPSGEKVQVRILDRSGSISTPLSTAPQGNFTVTADIVEGQQKVFVTISGFSGADFKSRVRPALDRVSSVKWDFPKNLGDGRRQMTGTVRGNLDSAIADVRAAASRFGA